MDVRFVFTCQLPPLVKAFVFCQRCPLQTDASISCSQFHQMDECSCCRLKSLISRYFTFAWESKCSWGKGCADRRHTRGNPFFWWYGRKDENAAVLFHRDALEFYCRLHKTIFLISKGLVRGIGKPHSGKIGTSTSLNAIRCAVHRARVFTIIYLFNT